MSKKKKRRINFDKMDYNNYYTQQAKENIPIFRGSTYQRGHGFGDVFKKLFRWIVPIVKANAKPIVKRVGRAAVKTAVNIASDALDGQDIKESAKKRIIETINKKSEQTGDGILEKTVYKRKRKRKKKYLLKKKKRKLDIFDN